MTTQIFTHTDFEFNAKTQVLKSGIGKLGLTQFPCTIRIQGKRSVLEFFQDGAAAIRNEFWDGEAMQYFSPETGVVFLHRFD